jgi:gas vesicle protein
MKDSTKILGALVLGAAAGAVLGLMFAPGPGTELRKKIKDNTEDLIDELAEKINDGKETLAGLTDRLMSKADEAMNKAEDLASKNPMTNGSMNKNKNTAPVNNGV